MECVAELAWTCKFLYTSSLASFSMLRRLLRIVKVAREQEAPFILTLKWLFDRRTWQTSWGQQCWQFYYASSVHRKPNRMERGPVSDRLTAMLRLVSHVDRSPVPIPTWGPQKCSWQRSTFPLISSFSPGVAAKSTTAEQIACSATSMSFFDRLWDKEIVRENGNIVKCFDEFVDDFTVSDELRKVRKYL